MLLVYCEGMDAFFTGKYQPSVAVHSITKKKNMLKVLGLGKVCRHC